MLAELLLASAILRADYEPAVVCRVGRFQATTSAEVCDVYRRSTAMLVLNRPETTIACGQRIARELGNAYSVDQQLCMAVFSELPDGASRNFYARRVIGGH